MSKCEHCGGEWKSLFEIVTQLKTKIVCFTCKGELVGHERLKKTKIVKTIDKKPKYKTKEVKTGKPSESGGLVW